MNTSQHFSSNQKFEMKKKQKKSGNLKDIPDEISLIMMTFLDKEDFLMIRLASKHFLNLSMNSLSTNEETRKYILNIYYQNMINKLNIKEKEEFLYLKTLLESQISILTSDSNFNKVKDYLKEKPEFQDYTNLVKDWKYSNTGQTTTISFNFVVNHLRIRFKYFLNDQVDYTGNGSYDYILNFIIDEKEFTFFKSKHFEDDSDVNLNESVQMILSYLSLDMEVLRFVYFILILIGRDADDLEDSLDGNIISLNNEIIDFENKDD